MYITLLPIWDKRNIHSSDQQTFWPPWPSLPISALAWLPTFGQSVVSIVGGVIVDVGLGGAGCDGVVLVGSGGLVDGVVFVDGVVLFDGDGGVQW